MLRMILPLGFLNFPSGSPAHKHSLSLLQCLALQAQVTTLTEQNEQHIKEIEKNKSQMSGVEVVTDSSEKVSWYFEEANCHTKHSERMWTICCVDNVFFSFSDAPFI